MKFNHRLVFLYIILLFILILNTQVLAGEIKFDNEAAQKLMNYDWQLVEDETEEVIIIYLLKFIRISNEFLNPLNEEMNINLSENDLNKMDIQISTDKALLNLIEEYKLSFVNDISSIAEMSHNTDELSSWLTTVANESVSVMLNEKSIEANNELYKLKIKLKPEKIDIANKRILTDVMLDYSNKSAQLSSTSTKAWIENSINRPVALLSKEELSGEKKETVTYALYLISSIIKADKLAEDTSLITVGNLKGLNNLFNNPKGDTYLNKKQMGVALNNDSFSINAYHYGAIKKSLDIDYYYNDTYTYDIGIELPIFKGKGLCISSNLRNKLDSQDIIFQLGISDTVIYKDNSYKLTYLPYSKDMAGNLTSDRSELKLELSNPEFNIWYQNLRSELDDRDELGMILNLNQQLGFAADYDFNQGDLSFGLIWTFYQGE